MRNKNEVVLGMKLTILNFKNIKKVNKAVVLMRDQLIVKAFYFLTFCRTVSKNCRLLFQPHFIFSIIIFKIQQQISV